MFSEEKLTQLNNCLLSIHKSVDLDHLCRRVLELLPELFHIDKSFFCCHAGKRTDKPFKIISLTMSDEELEAYHKHASLDYTAWFLRQSSACVYRDSDLVSPTAMESSVIYTDWMEPMGMRYCCGNVIAEGDLQYGDITVFRSAEHGDFSQGELFLFKIITDHLCLWFRREYPTGRLDRPTAGTSPCADLLSARERQIAELICEGLTTAQISAQMVITPGTTRKHIANIFSKLEVSSRVQLVKKYRSGL